MGVNEFHGPTDEPTARCALETELDHGVTLLDAADMYDRGDNERFPAPFGGAHRDTVVPATEGRELVKIFV